MAVLGFASCAVERTRPLWSRLLPPRGLQARLRWIFLLVSLTVQAATAAQLVLQPQATAIQPWSLAALGLLAAMHLVSFRRGRLLAPLVDALVESSLVGLATLGGADMRMQLWLYFQTLELRSLDGTWPQVGGAVLFQWATFAAVAALWPLVHGGPPALNNEGEVFGYGLGFVMAGVLMHAISTAAARHERGAARERSLAQAGIALVGASNRAEVYAAALDAVTDLLAGIPVSLVALSMRDDTTTTIVAARGPQAEALLGLSQPLSALPPAARLEPGTRQQVIDQTAVSAVQAALGFPIRPCVATLTQLRVKATHLGTLIVESPTRLPTETADGLTTMAAEIALALDGARLTEHLHQLAYTDPLTGLANRGRFVECLEQAVARARAEATSLAVLYLDLDDFKIINDSLGHAAGDQLLCTVAERLRSCVRADDDLVARLGGDEFTVLLEDVAGPDEASAIAQHLADELRECVELHGRSLTVGGSVGIALWQPMSLVSSDAGDLLRAADLALYAAKARGKGQVAMFEPAMAAQALDRLELEADLRQALAEGAFEVYYQPLVAFGSGAVQAVEALVRWNHPQRGTVGPAAFIGLAEETGLIVELGRWVLETACRDVRGWQERYPSPVPLQVNVNLSARQLRDPHLVDDVRRILETTGLDPATLKLEITESVAIADTVQNEQTLARLRQLGIRLAIDDFGTGNSAMDYLRRFPVDTLKIDRSFIEQLGREERSTALVRGMVALAKSLGLHVTGEGVETPEQSAQLQAMGCDLGQGFLFARPIPAPQLEATLRTERGGVRHPHLRRAA